MRSVTAALIFGATLSVAFGGEAASEVRCLEGRTASGECVNASLGAVMRKQSIIISQPKISLTTPLNLPSEDRFYPANRNFHEDRVFFGRPAAIPGGP
jgi:hypothetical protein